MSGKSNLALASTDIALVVFGPDKSKKLHASRFATELVEGAQKAAKVSGFRTFKVLTDEQRTVASRLPKGRLSPKGRVVAPLIRPPLYQRILEVAGAEAVPTGQPPAPPTKAGEKTASKPEQGGWGTELIRGSVVLAVENDADGWFECDVEHVDGETLTLKWQAWPEMPKFNRKVTQVAYFHPKKTKPY